MRRKKFLPWLLPLMLTLLACKFLFPAAPVPPAPGTVAPASATGFTLARLRPDSGSLETQLAAEVEKARALGQMPVVEFDANW